MSYVAHDTATNTTVRFQYHNRLGFDISGRPRNLAIPAANFKSGLTVFLPYQIQGARPTLAEPAAVADVFAMRSVVAVRSGINREDLCGWHMQATGCANVNLASFSFGQQTRVHVEHCVIHALG